MTKEKIQIRFINKDKPIILNHPEDKFETLLFLPPGEGRKGEGGLRTKGYFKHSYKLNLGDNLWYICDTAGNLVKPVPEEIQREIVDFIASMKNSEPEMANISAITELPLITVITVVLNGEKYLEQTIQSVINQTYPNVEYIIIDGGSTDGTLDIIKKYEDQIDYWVSEKDKGIYDAMNKGIDLATGKWINFMNAGDSFFKDYVISQIFLYNRFKQDALIYGNWVVVYESGESYCLKPKLLNLLKTRMVFSHNASFFPINLLKKEGYDTKYKIAADYKLILIAYLNNINFTYYNTTISLINPEGVSNKFIFKALLERLKIASEVRNKNLALVLFEFKIDILETAVSILIRLLPTSLRKLLREFRWRKYAS